MLAPHLRRLLFDLDRIVGAGLPILPGLAGESKSYAERLFSFPAIGALPERDAISALQDPVCAAGESFDPAALQEIFRLTKGYPYFLQEWGYQAWNHATASPISLQVLEQTSALVSQRLDQNFFRVRFDRLAPREKVYLRAMAERGAGPYRAADVAAASCAPVSDTAGPCCATPRPTGLGRSSSWRRI